MIRALAAQGVEIDHRLEGPGVLLLAAADRAPLAALAALQALPRAASALVLTLGGTAPDADTLWGLLAAGALDVLVWPGAQAEGAADGIACRLSRQHEVQQLVESPAVAHKVAGSSPAWRAALRGAVEAACWTDAHVLVVGDTGTGKEQLARLIHELGPRAERGRFVVLDCTTLSPELAGSEFFGHERGAFTGAAAPRDGAFALAHGGTLFLDEVGELSPSMQAQLLRVVQERQFKRLGSNAWQASDFRLVCATHRDLEVAVAEGRFRADLYHRLAGWRCRAPPLAERREDILPLATFFLRQCCAGGEPPPLDPVVRDWLLARAYPGNVRELRHLVLALWHHHAGRGPLTAGAVPVHERPRGFVACWPSREFEAALAQALDLGIGLKEITQGAADIAVRIALEREGDNLHRAAQRLGVTDRALQLRRQEQRVGP